MLQKDINKGAKCELISLLAACRSIIGTYRLGIQKSSTGILIVRVLKSQIYKIEHNLASWHSIQIAMFTFLFHLILVARSNV